MPRTPPPGGLNQSALETIDNHWAVRVVDSEDRAVAVRHAVSVLNRIAAGDASGVDTLPPLLLPRASAYALAGRELLDFEGAGAPTAALNERQAAVRNVHLQAA